LIDEFTIIEQGCELLTMEAEPHATDSGKSARGSPAARQTQFARRVECEQNGRELEILADGNSEQLLEKLRTLQPEDLHCESLSLEEIFVTSGVLKKNQRWKTMNKIPFNAETRRARRSAEWWSYNQMFLDCGGKRSAPRFGSPLTSRKRCRCCAPVFASFASAGCHRSPKSLAGKLYLLREPLRSLRLCVSAANFSPNAMNPLVKKKSACCCQAGLWHVAGVDSSEHAAL